MLTAALVLLLQASVLTPEQSAQTDDLARRYLTAACADGKERIGVVTVPDGVLHDLSENPTEYTVSFDEQGFRKLCPLGPLVAYHCHPTNDVLSRFPGLGMDGRSSDFGTAAFLEFICAEETDIPPVIEHRIVHTGDGSGTIVRFGLRGASLERARGLGRQVAEAASPGDPRLDRHGIPDLTAMVRAPGIIRALHEGLNELYAFIHESYGREVLAYLRKSCPTAKTEQEFFACTDFTVQEFVRAMEPCGDRYIVLPDAATPECKPATGERIDLSGGPRYAGWTELTPDTYEKFTAAPHAAVAFCGETGTGGGRTCAVLLAELERKLPGCRQLARGFVDTDRYPQLRHREVNGWPELLLFEDGKRYNITIPNPSPQLLTLIICGAETLFEGFAK